MWMLTYKGETKTFEEWGIKGAARRLVSLDIDTFQFAAPGEMAAGGPFEQGEVIAVLNSGKKWFEGPIDQTPGSATGRYESNDYVAVGPWWYLMNLPYQQHWTELANPLDPEAGVTTKYRSHLLLGIDTNGLYITTKAILLDVLNYCLGCAAESNLAPFQIGALEMPEFIPPITELTSRACSEVIYQILRWTPDAVGAVDYSTSPPTLNIRQRSALAKVKLDVALDRIKEISLKPRHDLKVPEVVLKYEITNIVDGVAWSQMIEDKAPADATGRKFGAIIDTISLEGASVFYSYSQIVCGPIATGDLEWWKTNNRVVGSPQVANLIITEPLSQTNFPNMLLSGTIAPWMLGNGKAAARDVIQAKAEFDLMSEDGKTVIEHKKDVYIEVELTATNLVSGTYKTVESATLPEPVPVGLAGYLLAATGVLHFDGGLDLVEEECSGKVQVGNLVNLEGEREEFQTMNAVVQGIVEDLDSGLTHISVGPPKHLGLDDIIEFLRANRNRIRLTPASTRSSGKSFSASPVALGAETPVKNTNAGNGEWEKFTVATNLIIDKADNPKAKEVRLREYPFCDDSSGVPVKRKILVWASEIYD
jgi:hypothetical protein